MHHRAKLTAVQASEIVSAHLGGMSQGKLAKQYGVSQATICQIVSGATHKNSLVYVAKRLLRNADLALANSSRLLSTEDMERLFYGL